MKSPLTLVNTMVVMLFIFLSVACSSETLREDEADTAEMPLEEPAREVVDETERCGDGQCDGPENEQNCPADCPPEVTETATIELTVPTPEPTATLEVVVQTIEPEATEASDPCGDGICSEDEQSDPVLCPQDCDVEETPAPVLGPVGGGWEAEILPSGELAHIGDPDTVFQEGGESPEPRQRNMTLILDASGSMNADLPGSGKNKLAVAKEVISELVPQVPSGVNGALWIYGHRLPDEPKDESCRDIERVFPLGTVDVPAYVTAVNAVSAKGYTPISDSIEQAALDLPAGDMNSIVLVSDGEETCAGNPCALAEALKDSEAEVTIHVVGYAVDAVTRDQLQCIARVSGGTYHDADDADGLLQGLDKAMEAAVVETILRVEVIAPAGDEVHANVHLYEPGTDQRLSSGVAWKDNAIVPGSYDILVDTLPWTVYQGLALEEESRTTIRIPLGAVNVLTPGGQVTAADFFDAAVGERLGHYGHNGAVYLAPGTYQIAVNGSTSESFAVEAGDTKELQLGSVKPLSALGEEISGEFYEKNSGSRLGLFGGEVLLVAGTYEMLVNNSTYRDIEVGEGEIVEVQLGAVEVEGDYAIFDDSEKRLGFYSGTLDLAPGTYRIDQSGGPIYENVIVKPGEVTVVK